jgi:hypothetical protein
MKAIYLFPFCLLLGISTMAQSTKDTTHASSDLAKPYDKIPKAHPLSFKWKNTSFGVSIGSATYLGDLQSKKITWSQSKVGGGIFLHNHLSAHIATRLMLTMGQLAADDANAADLDRVKRNLSFRSNIVELGLVGEYHFLIKKKTPSEPGIAPTYCKLAPYVMGGVAVFHFNPQAKYNGEWIDLKPLHTEGQTTRASNAKEYKLTQLSLPFGAGINYNASKRVAIGLEIGARKTFTDYIDDVSTSYPHQAALAANEGSLAAKLSWRGDEVPGRESKKVTEGIKRGNADNNDWYFMSGVRMKVKLGK